MNGSGVYGLFPGYMVYFRGTWFISGAHGLFPGYMVYFRGIWFISGVHGLFPGYMVYFRGQEYKNNHVADYKTAEFQDIPRTFNPRTPDI